ncbi:hypothetical protein FKV25_01220, partial [Lysobacter aestuarii]
MAGSGWTWREAPGVLCSCSLIPLPGCASLTQATRRVAVAVAVAVDLVLDLRDFEAVEHRRPWRPERRPCLSEASLGAVPPRPRRTGDRCGEA